MHEQAGHGDVGARPGRKTERAEATWGCFDGLVIQDTHQFGWRLHRAIRRSDTSLHRPGLLLYLPPSGSLDSAQIPAWAAELGSLTLVPDWYPSTRSVTKRCEKTLRTSRCASTR